MKQKRKLEKTAIQKRKKKCVQLEEAEKIGLPLFFFSSRVKHVRQSQNVIYDEPKTHPFHFLMV